MNVQTHPGELLRRAADGDQQAFVDFCRDVLPDLYRTVAAECRSCAVPSDLAKDLTHDTILRALAWLRDTPNAQIDWAWVRRIGRNIVVDCVRERSRLQPIGVTSELESPSLSKPSWSASSGILSRSSDPSAATDLKLDIGAALQRLTPSERQILTLVIIDGHRINDVARALGIQLWNAYKRYQRALSRLKELMPDLNPAYRRPDEAARNSDPARGRRATADADTETF